MRDSKGHGRWAAARRCLHAGLAGAAGSFTLAAASIDEAFATTVRYRIDGHSCSPSSGSHAFSAFKEYGFQTEGSGGYFAKMVCSVPLGEDLVMLPDSATHTIYSISVRLWIYATTSRTFGTEMWIHDYDADNAEYCDTESTSGTTGFYNQTLNWDEIGNNCDGASGGDYDNWALTIHAFYNTQNNADQLRMKIFTVHDDT